MTLDAPTIRCQKCAKWLALVTSRSPLQERLDEHNSTLTNRTPRASGDSGPPSLGLGGGCRRGRRVADNGSIHGGRGRRRSRGRQRWSRG